MYPDSLIYFSGYIQILNHRTIQLAIRRRIVGNHQNLHQIDHIVYQPLFTPPNKEIRNYSHYKICLKYYCVNIILKKKLA